MSAILLLLAVLAGDPTNRWQQNSLNAPEITKAEWSGDVVKLTWTAPKPGVSVAFVVQRYNAGMTNKFTVNPLSIGRSWHEGDAIVTYYWSDSYGQCNTPFTYRIKTKLASSDSGWSAPMMATTTVGEKPKE